MFKNQDEPIKAPELPEEEEGIETAKEEEDTGDETEEDPEAPTEE